MIRTERRRGMDWAACLKLPQFISGRTGTQTAEIVRPEIADAGGVFGLYPIAIRHLFGHRAVFKADTAHDRFRQPHGRTAVLVRAAPNFVTCGCADALPRKLDDID